MATTAEYTARGSRAAGARPIAVAGTAGLAAGALVGGLGGRVAMLVLRLTSDPSLRGLDTDDGFTIGIVSASTLFLVALTAVLGVLGGLAYLLARMYLPPAWQAPAFGSLAALVGGTLIIRPGGIDFTLLDPLWLAMALFVSIPAAFGVVVAWLVERWLADPTAFAGRPAVVAGALVALLPFVFLGLRGSIVLAVVALAVVALALVARELARSVGRVLVTGPAVWIGRGVLVAIGVAGAVSLVGDVVEIL
jgi:hypothetical protein